MMGRRRLVMLWSTLLMLAIGAGFIGAFVAATQSVRGRGGRKLPGHTPARCSRNPCAFNAAPSVFPGLTQYSRPPSSSGASKYAAPAGRW